MLLCVSVGVSVCVSGSEIEREVRMQCELEAAPLALRSSLRTLLSALHFDDGHCL